MSECSDLLGGVQSGPRWDRADLGGQRQVQKAGKGTKVISMWRGLPSSSWTHHHGLRKPQAVTLTEKIRRSHAGGDRRRKSLRPLVAGHGGPCGGREGRDSARSWGQRVALKGGEQRRKLQKTLFYFCSLLFSPHSEAQGGRPLQDSVCACVCMCVCVLLCL